MAELKPCPFCGYKVSDKDIIVTGRGIGFVQCWCGATGGLGVSLDDTVQVWNTRAIEKHNSEPLFPCPFCGGVAKLHQAHDSSYSVQCETCGNRTLSFKRPEEARQAWNNRPESQT